MIFICGAIDWHTAGATAAASAAMVQARRTARDRAISTVNLPGAVMAHAEQNAIRASVGSNTALLFRPTAEDIADDGARLTEMLDDYLRSGRLRPGAMSGAFMLVVIDVGQRRTLLATDRFGICPMYYRVAPERIMFSSDLDALVAHPQIAPALDAQAIYDYVFFHCIPSPRTIYQEVSKLGPAESLLWDEAGAHRGPYWQPDFAAEDAGPKAAGQRCQRRSKISPPGRSKTSPLNVMRYAVLGGSCGPTGSTLSSVVKQAYLGISAVFGFG